MNAFTSIFFNLLPLYAFIAAGYISGRRLGVDRQSLASLAIYIFMPVVMFGYVADMKFQPSHIVLPILLYVISVISGLIFFALGKRVYADSQANLMAMCVSMGNYGYFGIPLAMLFFDKEHVSIYIFMLLGGLVYEATFGYYIAARSNFEVRDSIRKLLRFPGLYAMAAGCIVNAMHLELPEVFWTYWGYVKGAYVVMGMMIIGTALANIKKIVFGAEFIAFVFFGKFVVIPLMAGAFIWIDQGIMHWLNPELYKMVVLISIVPSAANVAAYASQLDIAPEKAATTILIGTVFALIYIPAVIWLMGI